MIPKSIPVKEELATSRPSEVRARAPGPALCSRVESDIGLGELAEPERCSLSFDDVYDAHFDFVWRSLRLLGIPNEHVEDAIQDTFSVVSRQLPAFEGRSALRTWIFAILHRVAANYRRTRRRKYNQLAALPDIAGGDPGPAAHAEAIEMAHIVERFCAELAPERRALFVLSVLEELPAAEVAATLGLPVAKVYSRVHALREGLRSVLAAREVERG
jgi:RNA polymerase sigma-70 factor, ECF subfamily